MSQVTDVTLNNQAFGTFRSELNSILGALAPTLGAAIGGPLGGQAGSILSSVLGVPNNPKSIESAMNNITSEQMMA